MSISRPYTIEAQATYHTAFASRACYPKAPQLAQLTDFIIHFIELLRFGHRVRMSATAFDKWMYDIKYRVDDGAMEDPIMKAILEDTSEIRAWSVPDHLLGSGADIVRAPQRSEEHEHTTGPHRHHASGGR